MGFTGLKSWLAKRMPTSQQLAAVYGITVFVIYGWTIYWYLWNLPSWLYFMTLGEMLVTFAYGMAVNFLESILVMLVPVFLSLMLPSRWFRDNFVAHGAALVPFSLIALMQYLGIIITGQEIPSGFVKVVLLVIAGIFLLTFVVGRVRFLRRVFEEVASRATIFVYIFLPVSAISILTVLIRNLIEALNG